jgi:hypothetical protein
VSSSGRTVVSILPLGEIFLSDEQRLNSQGLIEVKLADGRGWLLSVYGADHKKLIEEVVNQGVGESEKPDCSSAKETVLEKSKKEELWKKTVVDTSFYEMSMMERQQHWLNQKTSKIKKLEDDKNSTVLRDISVKPDLSKTKDSWIKAKVDHENELMKAKLDEQARQRKDLEVVQKRRMNLAEKLKELKRLSKLNSTLLSEELKQEKTIKIEMNGLNQESNKTFVGKPKKRKKAKKKSQTDDGAESMNNIEYSESALSLLRQSMLDSKSGNDGLVNEIDDVQEDSDDGESVERIGWSDPSDDVPLNLPKESKNPQRNLSAAARYSANTKRATATKQTVVRPYSALDQPR